MNSEDLIAKYNKQTLSTTNQNSPSLTMNSIAPQPASKKKKTYYSQNSFKGFMGYTEPDYLMVAGLYASIETSPKSKMYGNFLVKGADYVAEALDWKTKDGKPDVKRAQTAIRTACRTEAPNGLRYMYSESNKDQCLSNKGGSRIYMSGRRRYELQDELQDELDRLNTQFDNISDNQTKMSEFMPQVPQGLERMEYMLREVAHRLKLPILNDGAIKWMAKKFNQEVSMNNFEKYCDFITSEVYHNQAITNRYCPKLHKEFDIYNKYKNIMNLYETL